MTLMEAVLALALLAILLIFVSGLFLRLLAGSEKSGDLTAGAMLAESILQEHCADGRFLSSANQRRLLYNRDGSQAEEFLYQVTCTRLAPAIYYVDVEVSWSGGSRQGQGQLKTRLGRLASP
ncbi:MAG: hypothetical protein KF760_17410 [Candidatus Eremiobacteraeota bacterium]|nr:hypothetical protein [Candidatus Eremiobacteraeota bacterium]MCW5866678.1 hypothetical protein [Candidatus Eremiobacteraeota bacterium]